MTHLLLVMLALLTIIPQSLLVADEGCLDNSWHLERYDNKKYHSVECYCPCAKRYNQSPDRGRCMQCLHYHIPKPLPILWPETKDRGARSIPSAQKLRQARQKAALTKMSGPF